MRGFALLPVLFFVFTVSVMTVDPAVAQATRTWVSGVGDDVNPCSRTAPCKTFAGAISKTAAAGEINCIDSGGFGGLTITKSITISCEGVVAGVLVSGTNGFTVNAAATDNVIINGIDFDGIGTGLSGISILSAASVHVNRTAIRNFRGGGSGITLAPNNITTRLFVSNSIIVSNGNAATNGGIVVKPTGTGSGLAVIKNNMIDHNASGVRADATTTTGTVRVTVDTSSVSGSIHDGITSAALAATGSVLMIDRTTIANNTATGVVANLATILMSNSLVTGNATGLTVAAGSSLFSYRNNNINGNANDNASVATSVGLQ